MLGADLDSHSLCPVPSTAPSLDPGRAAQDSSVILGLQCGEKILREPSPGQGRRQSCEKPMSQGSLGPSDVPSTLPQGLSPVMVCAAVAGEAKPVTPTVASGRGGTMSVRVGPWRWPEGRGRLTS